MKHYALAVLGTLLGVAGPRLTPRGNGRGTALSAPGWEDSLFFWRVLDGSWIAPGPEPTSNDNGQYAWGVSYRLEAVGRYLTIVPRDEVAWGLLDRDVRGALAVRDSLRGLVDYHGRSRLVWSATKYSDPAGVRAPWLVQNAMIVTGLASAAEVLRTGNSQDRILADSAIAACWTAMLEFDADLHNDPSSGGMYYRFPADIPLRTTERGREVPLNQQAAAGRAWWWLARLTGSSSARRRALGLEHFILTRVHVEDSSLIWNYQLGGITDDVSHGGVVAAFLMMLPPESTSSGLAVRQGLAGTFRRMLRQRGDTVVFADYVDGRITGESRFRGSFGWWAAVLPTACDLTGAMARALWLPTSKLNSPGPLGAALLLQALDSCPGSREQFRGVLRAE